MRTSLVAVTALLLSATIVTVANGLIGSLVSLRMSFEGAAVATTGAVMSGYYVGGILGALFGGGLVTRVGHIRTFAALAAILSSTALLHLFLVHPLPWGIFRGLTGFCVVGQLVATESWLNETAGSGSRGRLFSVYMVLIYLAFGGGQFLLNVADPAERHLFEIAAIVFTVSILPVALSRQKAPEVVEAAPARIRGLWESAPLALAGSVTGGLVFGAVQSLIPWFGKETGLSVREISVLLGAVFLSGLALQWPIGHLSDGRDRRAVIAVVSIVLAIASVLVALLHQTGFRTLLGLAVVFYSLEATLYPLSVAHAGDNVREGSFVSLSGGLLFCYYAGAAAGPFVAAAFIRLLGPEGLFIGTGAVPLLLAVYGVYRIRRRAPVEPELQTAFVSMPQTTPAAAAFDPRAGDEPGTTPAS